MPPLEDDEEKVKETKGLKVITPNKPLTRPPILLVQVKAENKFITIKKWNKTKTTSFVSA